MILTTRSKMISTDAKFHLRWRIWKLTTSLMVVGVWWCNQRRRWKISTQNDSKLRAGNDGVVVRLNLGENWKIGCLNWIIGFFESFNFYGLRSMKVMNFLNLTMNVMNFWIGEEY